MERPIQERFQVGAWTVEPRLNRIRRSGEVRQLDPRIMDVLVCLAGRPGEGFTKDELLDAVWGDVFVAENTLSQAVSRLRKALGDDWRDPSYIETISKTGYRLVAEVEQPERVSPTALAVGHGAPAQAVADQETASLPASARSTRPSRALTAVGAVTALVVVVVVVAAAIGIWRMGPSPAPASLPLQARPVVTLLGQEAGAALSPDGTSVAFAWAGPQGENWDLYLKLADGDQPRRLTEAPGPQVLPAWSPDGRYLAFVRLSAEETCEVARMPVIGGAAERLGGCKANPRQMAWSDDGRWLAFAASETPSSKASRIYLLEVPLSLRGSREETRQPNRDEVLVHPAGSGGGEGEAPPWPLSRPPLGSSDSRPAFSPDSSKVTFQRQFSGRRYELLSVAITGGDPSWPEHGSREASDGVPRNKNPRPAHGSYPSSEAGRPGTQQEPELLYSEPGVRIVGHDWTPQGQIIISLDRSGRPDLWNFDPQERQLGQRLTAGSAWVSIPRTARAGRRLIFDAITDVTHLYALDLEAPGVAAGTPRPLLNSTRSQRSARPSPDGSRIAFLSDRSGSLELWSGDAPRPGQADSPNLIRHTDFGAPLMGAPSWSPDSRRLVFDAYRHGHADLFSVGRESRAVRRLTESASNEVNPVYSSDGRWIYFGSDRTGSWQIHRLPAQGGEVEQVTRQGGFRPLEHPLEEGWIYSRYSPTEIWHVFDPSLREGHHARPPTEETASLARVAQTKASQDAHTSSEPRTEERVGGPLAALDWGNWAINRDGFYAVGRNPSRIDYYPLPDGGPKSTVVELSRQIPAGFPCLALAPDGRTLYFTLIEQSEDEIMLADY